MYKSKKEVINHIKSTGYESAYSPVFISDHYANSHGVGKGGWYVMNNITKQIVK
jgi:hypothetical protein